MKHIPMMPNEYKGKTLSSCGYTKTNPRKWTAKEIEWILNLQKQGYNRQEIAFSVNRSETAISIKLKRLGKKQNTYNKNHILEKYKLNQLYLDQLKPKTILDLYCGENSFYKKLNPTTNDINPKIKADYHEDAFKLICKLYAKNKKFDLIDLDPYGSAYDCFDLAIKMAKKGLIITFGELGHRRWKRLDYVETHYDINCLDDFTIQNLIKYVQKIGLRNKKELMVFAYKEWQNIGRVYFIIKTKKITKQWDNFNLIDIQQNNILDGRQLSIFDINKEE